MEEEKNSVVSEKEGVLEELDTLKKEQEDLLVLLADQDTKIANYKKLLKENNIPVSRRHSKFPFTCYIQCNYVLHVPGTCIIFKIERSPDNVASDI